MLFPNVMLDNIYDINIYKLKNSGIKGLILDIDNTLAGWDVAVPSDRVISWLNELKQHGFKVCLVSNNSYERVTLFNKTLDLFCICNANKPLKRSFKAALNYLNLNPNEVAVVGDQIFTDVFGGNRLEMFTILVKPISNKEFPFIQVKRFMEKIIFILYKHKKRKGR